MEKNKFLLHRCFKLRPLKASLSKKLDPKNQEISIYP